MQFHGKFKQRLTTQESTSMPFELSLSKWRLSRRSQIIYRTMPSANTARIFGCMKQICIVNPNMWDRTTSHNVPPPQACMDIASGKSDIHILFSGTPVDYSSGQIRGPHSIVLHHGLFRSMTALVDLHESGIIHGNTKPGTVLSKLPAIISSHC